MKRIKLLFILIAIISSEAIIAQVGINTDGTTPDASAILDLKSTEKGLLVPRMTQAEIAVIASPAVGLLVFNTDDNRFYFFDNGVGEWKEMAIGAGTITPVPSIGEVTNPTTGEIWMDRNLGATQVATSSTDTDAYGDLYQWGRFTEGHENRTSGVSTTNATTPVPNASNSWDGLFITETSSPYDWLTSQVDTLWQGLNGTNNPCPTGFRLPTEAEWEAERQSWATNDAAGAFGSPLKLVVGGARYRNAGSISNVGIYGNYWSSTVNGISAIRLTFGSTDASVNTFYRANGFSIRCIKD